MQTKSKVSNERVIYAYLLKFTRQLRKKAETEKYYLGFIYNFALIVDTK